MERKITEYGCIGEHLGHSFSAEIHAMLGKYDYRLCELKPEEVGDFMRARDFRGINVTIPYKRTVIPYLDSIDGAARAIGAVNTVLCRDGKLIGYNTDFYGMRLLLRRAGIDVRGQCAAVLGTGGTSSTACAVLRAEGAASVIRVSRKPAGEDTVGYDALYGRREDIGILLNTTPVGMFPHDEDIPADPADFPHLRGVADAVYHPLQTAFVCRARACGIPAAGGLYMLVAQAAYAAALFLDRPDMPDRTDDVYTAIRERKENIVLIGMPGSGKSTLGRLLAARTGKPFADSDALLAQRVGMTPAAYLTAHGEEAFRQEESAVLRELAAGTGCIIATGGGAVTRNENIQALRRNGRLVYLDRPLSGIQPSDDRPLTRDRAALERVFRAREALYREAADLRFPVSGAPEDCADRLLAALAVQQKERSDLL